MAFQRYFVERRCAPEVEAIRFEGAERASAAAGVIEAIADPTTKAILIAPSNPWLSVDPILAVPGVYEALEHRTAPVVAVSPIIAGQALKGPAAKLMTELDVEPGAPAVARHYAGLIDGLVIDTADAERAPAVEALGVRALVTPSVMRDDDDRRRLARETLAFAAGLQRVKG